MVVELSRTDIEKAIKKYVKDEILGYREQDKEMTVVQGKSASARVTIGNIKKEKQPDEPA